MDEQHNMKSPEIPPAHWYSVYEKNISVMPFLWNNTSEIKTFTNYSHHQRIANPPIWNEAMNDMLLTTLVWKKYELSALSILHKLVIWWFATNIICREFEQHHTRAGYCNEYSSAAKILRESLIDFAPQISTISMFHIHKTRLFPSNTAVEVLKIYDFII